MKPARVSLKKSYSPLLRTVLLAVVIIIGMFVAMFGIVWLELPPAKDREGRQFTNDLNEDFEHDTNINSFWFYKDGQAMIDVYGVHDADQQVSIRERFVRMLAERQKKRPESLKSVRLRFYRQSDDHDKPYAEFVIPAEINPP